MAQGLRKQALDADKKKEKRLTANEELNETYAPVATHDCQFCKLPEYVQSQFCLNLFSVVIRFTISARASAVW